MKLSDRARELLLIIDRKTDRDFLNKTIDRYYCPMTYGGVSGAGDANCLRGLERKGLIERMPVGDYSYAITEEGRLIAQEIG